MGRISFSNDMVSAARLDTVYILNILRASLVNSELFSVGFSDHHLVRFFCLTGTSIIGCYSIGCFVRVLGLFGPIGALKKVTCFARAMVRG